MGALCLVRSVFRTVISAVISAVSKHVCTVLIATLALSGCTLQGDETTPTPQIAGGEGPAVARQAPDWVDRYVFVPKRNAADPDFIGDEVHFRLSPGQCSRHRDAAGPSDCAQGVARSVIAKNKVFGHNFDFTLGHSYLITFDYWIDPQMQRSGAGQVRLMQFYGSAFPRNPLFQLTYHPKKGVLFQGRPCVAAKHQTGWHHISLRMQLSASRNGFLEVRCDSPQRSATPILVRNAVATARPWRCALSGRCHPAQVKPPRAFSLELGLIAPRSAVPSTGLHVKMRRITVKRLFVIIGRIEDNRGK